jgi:hypothetical protein
MAVDSPGTADRPKVLDECFGDLAIVENEMREVSCIDGQVLARDRSY